jgi:hypothetical protein
MEFKKREEYGTQSAKNKEVMARKRGRQEDGWECDQGIKGWIKV